MGVYVDQGPASSGHQEHLYVPHSLLWRRAGRNADTPNQPSGHRARLYVRRQKGDVTGSEWTAFGNSGDVGSPKGSDDGSVDPKGGEIRRSCR